MDQTAIRLPAIHPAPPADEILQELWREVMRLNPEAAPVVEALAPARAMVGGIGDARVPLGAGSLPALLALDGPAFIAAAYGVILGRSPDEAGIASVQAAMARGFSKIAVLGSLQRSPEGRATGRVIPGLRARALAHAAHRLPVLGGVACFGSAILRRSGLSPRLVGLRLGGRGLDREARLAGETRLAGVDARLELLEALHLKAQQAHAETVMDHRARIDSLARKLAVLGAENILALDRLAERMTAVSRQLAALDETLPDKLASLADGLDAQLRATLQIRADLDAHQRRVSTMSAELRGTLDAMRPALPSLHHHLARHA